MSDETPKLVTVFGDQVSVIPDAEKNIGLMVSRDDEVAIITLTRDSAMRLAQWLTHMGARDVANFRAWLRSHRRNQRVGYTFSECKCPLARWARKTTGVRALMDLSMDYDGLVVRGERQPTPQWCKRFARELDSVAEYHTRQTVGPRFCERVLDDVVKGKP